MPLSPQRIAELDQYFSSGQQQDYLTQLAPDKQKSSLSPERIAQLDTYFSQTPQQPQIVSQDNVTQYDAKTGMPYTQAERNAGVSDLTAGIETGFKQSPFWLNDMTDAMTKGVTRLGGTAYNVLGGELTPEQAKSLTNPTGISNSNEAYKSVGIEMPEAKSGLGVMGNLIGNAAGMGATNLASPVINKALSAVPEGVALRTKGFKFSLEDAATQSDANWKQASDLLKQAHDAGAVITPEAGQQILTKVKEAVGRISNRHADTMGELADFEAKVNSGNITLSDIDDFRQNFGEIIADNTKSKIDGGGLNSDGYKAFQAKQAISNSIEDLAGNPSAFSVGSPQAAAQLKEGINQYARASRFDKLIDMGIKSEGDSTALQANMKRFLSNEKNTKGFNDEELAALQEVADRGIGQKIERGLGTFGFDLGRAKNVALPYFLAGEAARGGGAAILPYGVPLAVAGTITRHTGKLAARGKLQNALDTVMSRDTALPKRILPSIK